ncbi:MAG TPA: 3-oxoacyl-[acyl-carrier-protein] synthase III C-terminal domain-containing protein [Candidatus Binatia bacterium]|jgi:3-oxoacyl-(acyl-carrier-protein) synthase III
MTVRTTATRTRGPLLPVRISGSASVGPGRAVSTAELVARLATPRDAADVERRSGIASRYFADAGASSAEVGATVLRRALDEAGLAPEALARIIFVCSLGGDMLFPATANVVAAKLGLAGTCDCFDLNNACMGFLTALDIAARGIATGEGPVGIVSVELPSRFITPDDPRPYLVFGDAAVAAVVEPARGSGGILASWLRNDGLAFGNVRLGHAGLTGHPETIRFTAPSARMSEEAVEAVRRATAAVLDAAALTLDDVQWILPHQPNGTFLDTITAALGAPAARVMRMVHEFGSVGSASMPVSLDRLLHTAPVRPGDRVLMVGVGAGISSGAVLLELDA